MRNLFNFLIRYNSWFLFIALEVISLVLLFTYNPYQESVYLSSANKVSGKFYASVNNFFGYFNLRSINEELLEQNGLLQERIIFLEENLRSYTADSLNPNVFVDTVSAEKYEFITARVISNSITRLNNYITLNKGKKDGLLPEMGVIDQNGVVGVINKVSDNYATVMPILNPKFRFSARLKKNEYFGSLVWDGKDPRYAVLEELPRHANFQPNDTVVTSGYSDAFPEGIMVGIVDSISGKNSENFSAIKVVLAVDFSKLGNVLVIKDLNQLEKRNLENLTQSEK
ncbi:MAG: rod shape-determining protein MreC [Candidatus Azobacteroides sp.]|nr:rod shape-determining protein MreC [Candidatus Azobacteroides sp.]